MLKIKKLKLESIQELMNNRDSIQNAYISLTTLGVFSCTFNDLVTKKSIVEFSNIIGNPRIMTYLRKDEEFEMINIVEKRGTRKKVFGDVWHSDHAYENHPPKFTLIHCPILPPYGGKTLFSSNHKSFKLFFDTNVTNLDGQVIINKMPPETQRLLKVKFPKGRDFEVETTKNIVENIYGFNVFTCNRYHTILPHGVNSTLNSKILNKIFDIQEDDNVLMEANWEENQILLWNNRLVLHKASNDYHGHSKTIWRILID